MCLYLSTLCHRLVCVYKEICTPLMIIIINILIIIGQVMESEVYDG